MDVRALWVALSIAIGLPLPTATAQPAPPRHEGQLTVELGEEAAGDELLSGWVVDLGERVLARPPELEARARIVILLDGVPMGYSLRVEARRDPQAAPSWTDDASCECTTDELLASLERSLEAAVTGLHEATVAEQRAAAAEAQRARERAEREAQLEREQERRAALAAQPYHPSRLGLAGAFASGLGGALLIPGIVLVAKGQGTPPDNGLLLPVDYRPPGHALLGVGLGVLGVGIGLLVTDVVRCRRDRVRCGERGRVFDRSAHSSRRGVAWR